MNFNNYLDIEQNFQEQSTPSTRDLFEQQTLDGFMEFRFRMEQSIKDRCFEYFYEDVAALKLQLDFSTILGKKSYDHASDDAKDCLMICPQFSKISQYQILSWLNAALKFTDHFVLYYLQQVKQVVPDRVPKYGEERGLYFRMMASKDVKEKEIGTLLFNLYGLRNKSEHRFLTDEKSGLKTILRPNKNQVRREVMKSYPNVLRIWIGVLGNSL